MDLELSIRVILNVIVVNKIYVKNVRKIGLYVLNVKTKITIK